MTFSQRIKPVAPEPEPADVARVRRVEILGPHLRIVGAISLGVFTRVTDMLNTHDGLFHVNDAQVLLRNGEPASGSVSELFVASREATVIAEVDLLRERRPRESVVPKTATWLMLVTPGHTISGCVYMPPGATIASFIAAPVPPFIPMTKLRVRSLMDQEVEAEYPFALLNRHHIVAVSRIEGAPSEPSVFDRLR